MTHIVMKTLQKKKMADWTYLSRRTNYMVEDLSHELLKYVQSAKRATTARPYGQVSSGGYCRKVIWFQDYFMGRSSIQCT